MALLIIAVTPPDFIPGEPERINEILSSGKADLVHIRKPYSEYDEMERLISSIKPELHPKLKIHDHFELLEKFNLGGIHLNSRNRKIYPKAESVSVSLHDLNDIQNAKSFDYFFISPIFNSISKPGYNSKFILNEISPVIRGTKAIALGGVTPYKFSSLESAGFFGAALLGYFFPSDSSLKTI